VGTCLTLDQRLGERAVIVKHGERVDAGSVFREHKMLVVDDVDWHADMEIIRSGLVNKRRAYKDDFRDREVDDSVWDEVQKMRDTAATVFGELFPTFVPTSRNHSFRPMITGPEPMHFDAFSNDTVPMVTSFVNISDKPRQYRLSYSFQDVVDLFPELMSEISSGVDLTSGEVSYRVRDLTIKGRPPIDGSAPKHLLELAPGSVWYFNSKTVSHEVVYGEGADSCSWVVPDCGAETQADILRRIAC
jgi:hypothetical protein